MPGESHAPPQNLLAACRRNGSDQFLRPLGLAAHPAVARRSRGTERRGAAPLDARSAGRRQGRRVGPNLPIRRVAAARLGDRPGRRDCWPARSRCQARPTASRSPGTGQLPRRRKPNRITCGFGPRQTAALQCTGEVQRRVRRHDPLRSPASPQGGKGDRSSGSPWRSRSPPRTPVPAHLAGAMGQRRQLRGPAPGRLSRAVQTVRLAGRSRARLLLVRGIGPELLHPASRPRAGDRAGRRPGGAADPPRHRAAGRSTGRWLHVRLPGDARSSRPSPTPGTTASSTWATTA